jgi:hypothetical protein
MEHTSEIDRDNAIPLSGVEIEEACGLANANTIEQYIEPAELAHHRRHSRINRAPVAHVEPERHSAPTRGADLRGRCLRRRDIYIGAEHRCTFAAKTAGASATNPATSAGYKDALSLDTAHLNLPILRTGL